MTLSASPLVTLERTGVFYGWRVVFAAGLGLSLGYPPLIVYSFTMFLKPMLEELHTSRGSVSLAFTCASLANAIASPLVGQWADRHGAKRAIEVTTAIFASTLIGALILPSRLSAIYVFFLLLGVAGSGPAPVLYVKVVSNWFDRHRGLALGVTMLGLGTGAILVPSLSQHLIGWLGWRGAYATLGVLALAVCLPIVGHLLRDAPASLGLWPDGTVAPMSISTRDPEGVRWSEARRDRTFWFMVGAFFLVGASVQGVVIHLAPMLTDRGISSDRAAGVSSLLGGALLLGRVGSGYLLDRMFAPRFAMFVFSGVAIGLALLWGGATRFAFPAAFLVGLGMGAEVDVIAYLSSRYFGLRCFGEIYGYAFASYVLGGAWGPALMGWGFDRTGSYDSILAGFCVATVFAAQSMLTLGPYRYRPQ